MNIYVKGPALGQAFAAGLASQSHTSGTVDSYGNFQAATTTAYSVCMHYRFSHWFLWNYKKRHLSREWVSFKMIGVKRSGRFKKSKEEIKTMKTKDLFSLKESQVAEDAK